MFYHYAQWRRRGTWERINAASRERHRVAQARAARPTAAIIDSRSARTTEAGGHRLRRSHDVMSAKADRRGYDGGEKVSGRKRHILVDTRGNMLEVRVHPADIHDRRGAELSLDGLGAEFPGIALVWADSAYQGLKAWLAATLG